MKNPSKDPENIGWAACVYINPDEKTILLVRNIKRESQIKKALLRQGYESEEDQRFHKRRVIWELSQKGLLEKPSKWELLGGKVAFWQGNPALHEKFKKLSDKERENFLKEIGSIVLTDSKLLNEAALHTAESEFVEESGLIAKSKVFLKRANDPDRDDPKNPDSFYPRFWYLVTEVREGCELRKEPVKETISAPRWVSLLKLHPFSDRDEQFPFHPSHCLGVHAAAKYFINNGRPEFAEVVKYLEAVFGHQKEEMAFEEAEDWESFAKTVKKLD